MMPIVGSVSTSTVTLIAIPVIVAALTSVATMWVARAGDATNQRRQNYAEAVRTLVAWIEFPYRVRRRSDDEAATLHELTSIGHDLQERLALHKAWISAEHTGMALAYAESVRKVSIVVAPALREAWNSPFISKPSEMNLGEWGPGRECGGMVEEFQRLISLRFGWQKVSAPLRRKWAPIPAVSEAAGCANENRSVRARDRDF
jgi:hypothetical protein